MARESRPVRDADSGSQEKLDQTLGGSLRGDIRESSGDADVVIEPGTSAVERGASLEPHSNDRGDGSDYYEVLKKNLLDTRRPYGNADDPARARFEQLMASMTDRQTPKGKSREVARVSIVATKIGFRATLTDYLISMKLTVDFPYLEMLFQALEDGIKGKVGWWDPVKAGEAYNRMRSDEAKTHGTSNGL